MEMNSSMSTVNCIWRGGGEGLSCHSIGWVDLVPWQNVIVALMVTAAVSFYVGIFRWSRRKRPGPSTWPVLGSLPIVWKNWDRLYDFFCEFFEEGPDAIWATSAFNATDAIYVAEPKILEHVLKTNFANYPKGYEIVRCMEELLGNGIFNSDHDQWKVQRKVASFEFSSANLRDFSSGVFKTGALALIRAISEFARKNQPMDMQDLFMRMTLDSTAKLGFGVDLGCLSPSLPAVPFAHAFDRANELAFHRYVDPLFVLKRYLNIGEERELRECLKVIDDFSYDVISRRKEDMKGSEQLGKTKTKPDLLTRFMSLSMGSNERYTDEALRDTIMNFILAGRDTTGVALSWFIYMMCLHPEAEAKVLHEIRSLDLDDQCLKDEGHSMDKYTKFIEALTVQNLANLHYLQAALSETLRLYPPVPFDGKTAVADDVLPNGTRVKKGNMVVYASYVMGRLKRVWGPDAREFKPERWIKNGVYQPEPPFKFVSFHAGPRSCLGRESAFLQMKLTVALLFRFFKFEQVPDHVVTYRLMIVLCMRSGIKVTASPR